VNENDTRGGTNSTPARRGELVPMERARCDAYPVRALRDAARAALAAAAEALFARWCRDWGAVGSVQPDRAAQCVTSCDVPQSASIRDAVWYRLVTDDAVSIWWSWQFDSTKRTVSAGSANSLDAVQAVLFGGHCATGGLGADAAATAWADWCRRLALQCGATYSTIPPIAEPEGAQALPERFSQRWTGAVMLRLAVGGQILWLAFDAAAAESWLRSDGFEAKAPISKNDAPLTSLGVALRDATVNVRIELQPIEVELGDLMTLVQGDVIRTHHAIDSPLHISVSADDGGTPVPLCHAHLGMRDGARAVVLVKPTA
jgi:flagellar motor switch/type III secretory pathway protein FliN